MTASHSSVVTTNAKLQFPLRLNGTKRVAIDLSDAGCFADLE
jgi:hypothetical protein